MFNLILYAVPYFVALLAIEWVSFRHTGDHDEAMAGYDVRDTATSLSMGLGNLLINLGWKLVVLVIYSAVYELTPLRVPSNAWWAWVLLFFADDLAYYWFHRVSHEVRVFWAGGTPYDLRTLEPAALDLNSPHLLTAAYIPASGPTPLWDAFNKAQFPDPELREYALNVLASVLRGGNKLLPIGLHCAVASRSRQFRRYQRESWHSLPAQRESHGD